MLNQLSWCFVRDVEQAVAYQYMLLADPDAAVRKIACNEKKRLLQTFPDLTAIVTWPHITLLHFRGWLSFPAREKLESRLCNFLNDLCCKQCSFPVELKNYEGFHKGTIYICVQNAVAFLRLQNNLRDINAVLGSGNCSSAKVIDRLHMTLVRGLDAEDYDRLLPLYSQRRFHAVFPLKKLTLLRRTIEGGDWQHVKHFYLPTERALFH